MKITNISDLVLSRIFINRVLRTGRIRQNLPQIHGAMGM